MNRTPVRSSNIASAGYENGTLKIAFFNGGVCQYFNVPKHIDYVIPVRGYSIDVVDKVRKISPAFNLLFIDGDHSYEAVKADWEAYKEFLKPESVVVFHDYGWAEGVKRAVHDDVMPLAESHDQLPNMWWCRLAKKP